MKNLLKSIFVLLFAAAFVHPIVPAFVNFNTPYVQPGATTATMADSNMIYVIYPPAKQNSDFKRISMKTFENYLASLTLDSTWHLTDTVTGYSTVVTDTVTCTRSFGGGITSCRIGACTGTSNATAHAILHFTGGHSTPYVPVSTVIWKITDTSTVFYSVAATMLPGDTLSLTNNATAFKNSGTFALTAGTVITFPNH